jgi:hypothetical protein
MNTHPRIRAAISIKTDKKKFRIFFRFGLVLQIQKKYLYFKMPFCAFYRDSGISLLARSLHSVFRSSDHWKSLHFILPHPLADSK